MMKSQLVLILCVPLCVMCAGPVTDLLVQNTGTLAPRLAAQIILEQYFNQEYDCIIRLGVDIVISPCQLIIIIYYFSNPQKSQGN